MRKWRICSPDSPKQGIQKEGLFGPAVGLSSLGVGGLLQYKEKINSTASLHHTERCVH